VSREIRGSLEDAQNRRDIPRMIELGEKSIAFPSRLIFAPAASHRFSSTLRPCSDQPVACPSRATRCQRRPQEGLFLTSWQNGRARDRRAHGNGAGTSEFMLNCLCRESSRCPFAPSPVLRIGSHRLADLGDREYLLRHGTSFGIVRGNSGGMTLSLLPPIAFSFLSGSARPLP
jgi:hypothetical protein